MYSQDLFTNFHERYVALGAEMHSKGKCEAIAVLCARPTQHKKGFVTLRLLACGGNLKERLYKSMSEYSSELEDCTV